MCKQSDSASRRRPHSQIQETKVGFSIIGTSIINYRIKFEHHLLSVCFCFCLLLTLQAGRKTSGPDSGAIPLPTHGTLRLAPIREPLLHLLHLFHR